MSAEHFELSSENVSRSFDYRVYEAFQLGVISHSCWVAGG